MMQELFGAEPAANDNSESRASRRRGEWQPIATAPKDRPVDLWVAAFGYDSVLVENCRWDANAAVPDWYREGDAGQAWLAVRPIYHATHWKELGAAEGPHEDGGPPIRARTFIHELEESWPAEMRARLKTYREAMSRGTVDEDLFRRGWDHYGRAIEARP